MTGDTRQRRAPFLIPVALVALGLTSVDARAQTIRGRLLDVETGEPVDLGILVLLTLEQDTVTMTASTPDGRFSLAAPDPGSYLLRASALGYAEKEEGVFELGEGGRLNVEFRIVPRPMELEGILVSIDGPTRNHPLVRNGFVERYRRGLGHFITPRDLERTVYPDTESLFHLIPGVRVVTSNRSTVGGRSLQGPLTERVLMGSPRGRCVPTVYIDGARTPYRPGTGETLSSLLQVDWVAAVEVYSRPVQVPVEYGGPTGNLCGLIVFWTKR
jgi:hypothetical protein